MSFTQPESSAFHDLNQCPCAAVSPYHALRAQDTEKPPPMTQRSWDLELLLPLLVYKVMTVGGQRPMVAGERKSKMSGISLIPTNNSLSTAQCTICAPSYSLRLGLDRRTRDYSAVGSLAMRLWIKQMGICMYLYMLHIYRECITHQKQTNGLQLHPNTSAMLEKFHLKLPIETKMPIKSTVISTADAVINRGLKILYSIRCLLNQPAHIVVAKLITA